MAGFFDSATSSHRIIDDSLLSLLVKVFQRLQDSPELMKQHYRRYSLFEKTGKISIRALSDAAANHLFRDKRAEFGISDDDAWRLRGFFETDASLPENVSILLRTFGFLVEDYN